ncbi:MAG TPA: hypothetical protein VIB39_15890 [Candidatus Angelobacter sp.]
MSTIVESKAASAISRPEVTRPEPALSRTSWQILCAWLTRELKGLETTIERRDSNGEWVVECVSYPLLSVTTRWGANGVQVISIKVKVNGNTKLFEVSGPNTLDVKRNAAGWPIRIELGNTEGRTVLLFSGQMDPERWASRNAWGE